MGVNEVVLGLLIERPGTSHDLEQRLRERFGSAQFSRGTASNALKRLAESGLIRTPEDRRSRRYVPTQTGIERFRLWMRSAVATPPVREELHAKIALCQPADLPAMIQVVRDAENACGLRFQGLQWRMQDERRGATMGDWRDRMDLLVRSADVAWWGARITWLQGVRASLERERRRYEAERHVSH